MLHRALQQFLADVYWGDLDVLLLDLPPGTGDIAISVAQLLPDAELLVVTTPQVAAAEVAERAGSIALQTHQRVVGVVENMSWLELPDGTRLEVFGSGGGQAVADNLGRAPGPRCRCSARSRWTSRLREAGDAGTPVVLAAPGVGGRGRAAGRRTRARAPRPGARRSASWASPPSPALNPASSGRTVPRRTRRARNPDSLESVRSRTPIRRLFRV